MVLLVPFLACLKKRLGRKPFGSVGEAPAFGEEPTRTELLWAFSALLAAFACCLLVSLNKTGHGVMGKWEMTI